MSIKKIFFLFTISISLFYTAKAETIGITVSSTELQQGDTILVRVHNEPVSVSGTYNSKKLLFIKSSTTRDFVSIIGIDAKQKPGKYKLEIIANGKQKYSLSVTVKKRNFKVYPLAITQALKKEGYTAKKIAEDGVENSNPTLDKIVGNINKEIYFQTGFITPLTTNTVVGAFGDIRKNKYASLQHLGVDLRAYMQTPVSAINNGKVVLAKNLPNYGNTIVIDHGYGIYSLYLHLDKFNKNLGDSVNKGEQIALSGNSGYTLGAHLHFSVKVGNASVDPLRFIETTKNI